MKQKNRGGASSISPCPATVAIYSAIMRGGDSLDRDDTDMQLGDAHRNGGIVCFTV